MHFGFFMGSISSWSHFLIVNCCEHWHLSLVFEIHSKKFTASVSNNFTSLQFCLFQWFWITLVITANCSTCQCAVFKEIFEECYNCVPIINISMVAFVKQRLDEVSNNFSETENTPCGGGTSSLPV